jgi:hypothetical protein
MIETSSSFGPLKVGILLSGLITAIVHLVVLNVLLFAEEGISIIFTLNGLGYLALLAAFFLQVPVLQNNRGLIRWVFIGYTALTILAWIPAGSRDLLGYGTKLVEIVLIVMLYLDQRRS